MTTIVTRAGKGSPLTHTEVDTNFTNLNTAKLETAAIPLGTLGAPSISFLSYSTTGIYSPAGDELGVSMLGSDKIRIKSTGEIIINATASRTTLGIIPRLQIEGSASSNQCSVSLTGAGAGSSLIPRLYLSKARSSVNAVVLEDDILGFILFNGGDGSSLVNAGFIKAEVDGTPSAGIVPGRLVFATVDTAGGSGERMIIKNNGNVSIDGTTFNVDAVNNRVGIGTTSPAASLDVSGGSIKLRNASSGTNYGYEVDVLHQSGVSQKMLSARYMIAGASGSYADIAGINAEIENAGYNVYGMSFRTGGSLTERVRIDGSGRLLVGTSTAITNLEPFTTPSHQFVGNDSTTGGGMLVLGKTASSSLYLSRGQSGDAVSLGANGLIGALRFTGYDGSQYSRFAHIICEADAAVSSNISPGRLVFSTTADGAASPTERMRIDKSGSHALYGIDQTLVLSTNQASSASLVLFYGRYGATAVNGGTDCIYIRSNGNIQNTNNSYGAISDAKLKENIVDANSQWSDIKALQVRKYNFKEETGHQTHTQIGLVAQEVELISPGLVSESPDRDNEGNDLGTVTKSVNYSVLYMKAVKALQEAMGRIETLEASNTDLLARVTALESA